MHWTCGFRRALSSRFCPDSASALLKYPCQNYSVPTQVQMGRASGNDRQGSQLVLSKYVVSKLTNETLNRLSLGFAEIEERSCMRLGQDEAVELLDRPPDPSTDHLRVTERSA
jgi:hypothetical protein